MELLGSISVNQVESRETFHLRWINCLPKQKETPLILINGNAEVHKLIAQDVDKEKTTVPEPQTQLVHP